MFRSSRSRVLAALAAGFLVASVGHAYAQTTTAAKATTSKLATLTKSMKKVDGLWTLYHDDQKLYVHLKSTQLAKEYMVLSSIARGVSVRPILGGMTWEDALWSFRKVGKKMHVLRKNVRFRARKGSPEAEAVKLAYSDSVMYALPILTSEGGGDLVDMTRIFMSDDQQIGRMLGARFATDRSTWAKVTAYPQNVELQVAAVYAGTSSLETVADPRGMQVNVHYSISELPTTNGYKPRVADDRVGYFLTVAKDFTDTTDDLHFVRYVNRWDLQKAAPKAKLSPPKTPIIFHLEKTVPLELRATVREAILEWNKAFEKVGFTNAIEVRQQTAADTWNPEDVRYNTFRWITAEAGFAMGPSRVNPRTGQILDADIIFDASFLRYWKEDYETLTPEVARNLLGVPLEDRPIDSNLPFHPRLDLAACNYGYGMQHQMGFSAAVMAARGLAESKGKLPDEFVHQALKEVVMHEVGHTLGLRHNFKASSWKSLADIEAIKADSGEAAATVSSVMDYVPANISAKKEEQGRYYTGSIGPYDYWAIEYGYKPVSKPEELKAIAASGAKKGLDYATDEDARSASMPDPLANLFDLGKNPVDFTKRQMAIAKELLPKVVERSVEDGEEYARARKAFGALFSEYWRSVIFAARFPSGVYVHRDHKGDASGRDPFVVVEAEKQRAAMKFVVEHAFAAPSYDAGVLNKLASTRWSHWGLNRTTRLDYPIHETVETMQSMILSRLTSPTTLARLLDNEVKVAADADAYTLAEHMRLLVDGVFSEMLKAPAAGEFGNRTPYVDGYRRGLQRMTLKRLASMVTNGGAPEDARTLARMHLSSLKQRIDATLANDKLKLDDYSRAHLMDSGNRIRQVLDAELGVTSVQ